MYRGWTQTEYQNKHYNINQKDERTLDDRGRDGGTNFILRIKEQETRLTLQEHDDDDEKLCIDGLRPFCCVLDSTKWMLRLKIFELRLHNSQTV